MEDARDNLRRWLDGMQAAITAQHQYCRMVMEYAASGSGLYGHDDMVRANDRLAELERLGHLGATVARFLAPDLLTPTTAPADSAASPGGKPPLSPRGVAYKCLELIAATGFVEMPSHAKIVPLVDALTPLLSEWVADMLVTCATHDPENAHVG